MTSTFDVTNSDHAAALTNWLKASLAREDGSYRPTVVICVRQMFYELSEKLGLAYERRPAKTYNRIMETVCDFLTWNTTCAEMGTLVSLYHFDSSLWYVVSAKSVWSNTRRYYCKSYDYTPT